MKTFCRLSIIVGLIVWNHSILAQNPIDISFEFQGYPTGIIPGMRIEKNINKSESVHIRIGYNWIRHRDLGVHDDERGSGYGFTLGYKRYFVSNERGWNLGLKSDIWRNSIDWRDDLSTGPQSGMTEITVIQPSLELGYLIQKNKLFITPTIAFGYEWNVKTSGAPTGEGAILLFGFQLGKRFL